MRRLAVDFDRQPAFTGLNAADSDVQVGKLSLSFGLHREPNRGVLPVHNFTAKPHRQLEISRNSLAFFQNNFRTIYVFARYVATPTGRHSNGSVRKLGRIPEEGPSFRVETSCSIKRLLEDEELCC